MDGKANPLMDRQVVGGVVSCVVCRVSSVVCGAPRLVSRVSCPMSRVLVFSCLVSRVLASRVSYVSYVSCRVVSCRVSCTAKSGTNVVCL